VNVHVYVNRVGFYLRVYNIIPIYYTRDMTEERRLKRLEQNRKSYHKNKERYNEIRKLRRLENIESYKELDKKQYQKHKEKVIERKKKYYKENRDRIREYKKTARGKEYEKRKERMKNDPVYGLQFKISNRIRQSVKRINSIKTKRTQEILGINYQGFKEHLESLWEPWMNWDNYGKYKIDTFNYGWDIDHIIPACAAETIEDVYKLNHYTNLKPLCSKVNRDIKRARYSPDL
jgi:Pyruvate/2-oxoacid:ferredoxin oxidoreductase gamma subunit